MSSDKILTNLFLSLAWWWLFKFYLSSCTETFLLVFSTWIIYDIRVSYIKSRDNLSLQKRGCGQDYKEIGVWILAGMKNSSAAQCLSRCCDSISSVPKRYRRLYSGIKRPRGEDDCAHPSAAEVNCLVLVTGAEVPCWLWVGAEFLDIAWINVMVWNG